jgi:hypothetical protein
LPKNEKIDKILEIDNKEAPANGLGERQTWGEADKRIAQEAIKNLSHKTTIQQWIYWITLAQAQEKLKNLAPNPPTDEWQPTK